MSKRISRRSSDRKQDGVPQASQILIVCEGERTEPNYFSSFTTSSYKKIVVLGVGMNTLSLVERTIELSSKSIKYEQVWCVFDLDSFPKQNFEKAIKLAKNENIRVAYSNEAFEIWYLLHFDYHQSAMSRDQYKAKLTEKLGRKYEKSDPEIYSDLLRLQEFAIANAQRLLKEHHSSVLDSSDKNPSTTVHELVLELNKYVR